MLWLAYRYHIPEPFVKHASITILGEKKGPDDLLFKECKRFFGFIDLDKRTVWKWPNTARDWRHRRANGADSQNQKATWPSEDYRLQLFLGGVVKGVHCGQVNGVPVQIRKPGAIHRAQFMAFYLSLLKICLCQN